MGLIDFFIIDTYFVSYFLLLTLKYKTGSCWYFYGFDFLALSERGLFVDCTEFTCVSTGYMYRSDWPWSGEIGFDRKVIWINHNWLDVGGSDWTWLEVISIDRLWADSEFVRQLHVKGLLNLGTNKIHDYARTEKTSCNIL